MESKLYIDFSNDEEIEYSFDDLLRTLLNAPLFTKPAIGNEPLTSMEDVRADRTADGVKSVMEAIASTYDDTSLNYISFKKLLGYTSLRRFSFDKYLSEAVDAELVRWVGDGVLEVTEKGREYIFSNDIVNL